MGERIKMWNEYFENGMNKREAELKAWMFQQELMRIMVDDWLDTINYCTECGKKLDKFFLMSKQRDILCSKECIKHREARLKCTKK